MNGRAAILVLLIVAPGARAGGIPGEAQRAFTFSHDFGNAAHLNPASIARQHQPHLTVSYFPLYDQDDYVNFFAAAVPVLSKITLGAARFETGMGGIAGVDAFNRATGRYYSDRQALYLFTAAQAVDERLSIGLNAKFVVHDCLGERATGWGVDAGVRFVPLPELTLGAAVHNFILRPAMQYARDEISWPTSVLAEAAFRATDDLVVTAQTGLADLFTAESEYNDGMPIELFWRAGAAYRVMENGNALLDVAGHEALAGFTYMHDVFRLSYLFSYHYTLGFGYRTTLELTYGRSRKELEARAATASSKKSGVRERKKAHALLRKGEYWRAAREFGKQQAGVPDSIRAQSGDAAGLALSLRGMGLHYAAEKALAASGTDQLENADRRSMLYTRFKRAARIRETARAEALFAELENAGGVDEMTDRARYDMAVLCRRTGQNERIPALLQGIREESDCYMYAQYWLAQLAYARGDAEGALAYFDRVIAARPFDGPQKLFRYKAQQKAGHVLFGLGRYDDAYDRYARALGGDYRRDETLLGIAWTFFRQREFKRSLGAAEQLLREYGTSPYAAEALLISAYCFMVLDYYEEALDHFNRAAEAATASGVDTVAAAIAEAENMERIRGLQRELKTSEEQLVAYLTDPALIPLDDARERLRGKIDIISQKIGGLERSISAYRRTAAADKVALAVRRDAEFGLAMVDGVLKEEKMQMMKKAYEQKMQELEQMLDDAE